jgi:hypothetical protein
MTKAFKEILWKRTELKRSAWENRYSYLFRIVLNKQFKTLADKIDSTNYGSTSVLSHIERETTEKAMISLYKNVGSAFARDQYNRAKAESQSMLLKQEPDEEDYWYDTMESYAKNKAGDRITSITGESRKQAQKVIKSVMQQSTDNGWGADETARQIRKALLSQGQELNQWRALRIARTEVMTASNWGSHVGAQESGYAMEKYWIATYDSRTRDTHLVIEQQNPKDMDEGFRVGAYLMEIPGDPDAGPEEVINCRCAVGYQVKGI